MDAFLGSWKMVDSVNFDKYLDALGLPDVMKRYGINVKVLYAFSQDEEYINIKVKMYEDTNRTFTVSFKLGQEFDETTIDFRACRTVFNLEGGKLIEVQKWEGNEGTTTYEIQDGKMIMTLFLGDVVSVRTFEKA
ncbi:fatty acid-binding protein, brain-like [Clarias gariepinus]|uniref:fatty acid-binding protein, brain-like n=1 Tax=Clarias gariepinus TaxID=13013 RepID=UPI00234DD3D2|nr:fatty acid-binding protein, brain-like [Clarias gariepinus]